MESQPQNPEFGNNPESFYFAATLMGNVQDTWVKVKNFQNPELSKL